jgi:YVTN family beta-propeller protein
VRIDIGVAPGSTNPRSGPRGLAIKYENSADPSDPGDRLYVMNRLDNSIAIVDPATDSHLGTIALANDPTPDYVREGREFLYSADLSGNKFVSCASCHMDARTDSLVWKLGTPNLPASAYPPALADGLDAPTHFLADKGGMVTQSLQGLVNFEVEPKLRDFFTNAPYHWRGDRADFTEFAGAFQSLMGAAAPLDPVKMKAFETFVNSVNYPPNPRQPDTRAYSGGLGNPDDDTSGTDARLGLKLFHITPLSTCMGRSCVQCHALPESSNNRGTVPTAGGELIETAQTRGLFQREARQDKAPGAPSPVVTAEFGLTHLGLSVSLNGFLNRFIPAKKPDGTPSFTATGLLAVKSYMRQFDFGVAPLVGRSYTVDMANKGTSETNRTVALFENQARLGNVGVAVYSRIGGAETGYWFDLTAIPAPAYRVEGSSPAAWIDRATLLAGPVQLRDRLVFTATPLGSERRVAALDGKATALSGAQPPSALELRPLVANTANVEIPSLRKNWDPNALPGLEFQWTNGLVPTPPFPKAIRFMQHGLVTDGQGQYGLTALRHEAPRRFAVAGFDILPGAKLRLFVPNSTVAPNPAGPQSQISTTEVALPLNPTGEVLPDGRRVWQSAVEAEPLVVYELMLGGPLAPGMPFVLDPTQVLTATEPPAPGTFDPHRFNWHYVKVLNPDGQEGDGGWQRLRLP